MENEEVITDLQFHSKAELDVRLNAAVDIAREIALNGGSRGILVTRHGFSRITVSLSPQIPFGSTRERDLIGN